MLKLTLRNLVARKVRLLLSAFAIVLGVGFVAGSFVFTDTMGKSFDEIAYGTVSDVNVRPTTSDQDQLASAVNIDARTIDASVRDDIAELPDVARADGMVQAIGMYVITKENRLLGGTGAPTLAFNDSDAPNASGEQVTSWVEGRAPRGPKEIGLDATSAEKAGYQVGDTVKIASAGEPPTLTFKLTGLLTFQSGGLAGATLLMFDTPTAQDMFMDGKDEFNTVVAAAKPGVSQKKLAAEVSKVLPDGLEAVTGDDLAAETKGLFDTLLGFLNTFLLVFAGIALVVGSFLIVNTFSMLVAQRSSELALMRAIGASKRQVQVSVLIEAFVVGLVGSALGLAFGFGLAGLLKALLGTVGLDLSGTSLVFAPRTAVIAFVVGIVVTMVAAYLPGRRASKVAPIEAMRDVVAMSEGSLRWRLILGSLLGLVGLGLMGAALFGEVSNRAWWVGGGILAVLLSVIATSVATSTPVLAGLGRIFRMLYGFIGKLAEQNARRNPRRTSATASALMIGLALVTTMSILGASINASIDEGVEEQFTTDFLIQNQTGLPFSPALTKKVAALPGVEATSASQTVGFQIGDSSIFASAVDSAALADIFTVTYVDGKAPGDGDVAMTEDTATAVGAKVGQKIDLKFPSGPVAATVSGIYADTYVVGQAIIPFSIVTEAGLKRADSSIAVNKTETAGFATVRKALERVTASNPAVVVQDKQSFAEAQRSQVNTLLYLIYALLGLAIVIAVLGIVNTLALSVIERTRELGLLRAVGLERGQLRRMVRLESIAIAVLGAVLGIAAGLLFGTALQRTFADEGITVLSIPVVQLLVFLVVAAVVGVLAAVLPARRAAKLDILKAIGVD